MRETVNLNIGKNTAMNRSNITNFIFLRILSNIIPSVISVSNVSRREAIRGRYASRLTRQMEIYAFFSTNVPLFASVSFLPQTQVQPSKTSLPCKPSG